MFLVETQESVRVEVWLEAPMREVAEDTSKRSSKFEKIKEEVWPATPYSRNCDNLNFRIPQTGGDRPICMPRGIRKFITIFFISRIIAVISLDLAELKN